MHPLWSTLRIMDRNSDTTLARRLALAVVAAVALLPAAAPSALAQDRHWAVAHAATEFGLTPDVQLRVTPPLPAGAELEGVLECREVFVPGTTTGQKLDVTGDLPPGVYQFVKDSCSDHPVWPLRLTGSSAQLVINAGQWVISPAETKLGANAIAGLDAQDNVVSVSFFARVLHVAREGSAVRGQRVSFYYENGRGLLQPACSAVSEDAGDAVAACEITGEQAKAFERGTGKWTAIYSGSDTFARSLASGTVPGMKTDATAAAEGLQLILDSDPEQVKIVQDKVPAAENCRAYTQSTNVSIIGVSIANMTCSQFRVVQIATQVGMAVGFVVAPIGTGVGILVAQAAQAATIAKYVASTLAAIALGV